MQRAAEYGGEMRRAEPTRKPLASTPPFAKNAFTCLFARLPFAIFQQDHTGKA